MKRWDDEAVAEHHKKLELRDVQMREDRRTGFSINAELSADAAQAGGTHLLRFLGTRVCPGLRPGSKENAIIRGG
jgi:hypothetical protein